jgi:YbbR domain-containing protein
MMDRLLENDTVLKILSLLVAIAVWVQVNTGPSGTPPVRQWLGPLTVSWSLPSNPHLTVLGIRPDTVHVLVQGPPANMANVASTEAWVNLTKLTGPGTYTMQVAASVPTGDTALQVQPKEVVVTVDSVSTRHYRAALQVVGQPPGGYGVIGVSTPSRTVSVTGPSRYLTQVNRVVGKVAVSGQTSLFHEQVILFPVNQKGQVVPHVQVSPEVRTVTVAILPEKTVPVVVKYTGRPGSGLTIRGITVSPNQVTIAGSAGLLAGVAAIDTAPVSVAGATSTVTANQHLQLPSGLQVVGSPTVNVTITIGP